MIIKLLHKQCHAVKLNTSVAVLYRLRNDLNACYNSMMLYINIWYHNVAYWYVNYITADDTYVRARFCRATNWNILIFILEVYGGRQLTLRETVTYSVTNILDCHLTRYNSSSFMSALLYVITELELLFKFW